MLVSWMRPSESTSRTPRELCSKMHGPVSIRLWVLSWLSCACLFSFQPVLSELVFSAKPEDAVGLLGAPLTLDCAVYDLQQQRALSVLWERATGEPTAAPHTASVDMFQLFNGSLFFRHLRESNLGNYVCSAAAGADRISATVRVEKAGLGVVFFSPKNQTVREGERVFLQCVSGDSAPPALISWLKDGELVDRGKQIQGQYGGGKQRKTSGTLHLTNVTHNDEGIYVCVTHNPLLNISQKSVQASLTILGAPRSLQIIQDPSRIAIAKGTQAHMRCMVHGFTVPMVHWFKDDRLLTNFSASLSSEDNGQLLVFRNVSEEDEGSYYCEASTQQESVRSPPAFLLLAVMGWRFVHQPSNQTVKRGENATLVCRPPNSKPPAHISWFRDNRLLRPQAHFTLWPGGDLFFHSVQESDTGTYFCRAFNDHLNRSVSSRIVSFTVLARPSVRLQPKVVTVPPGGPVLLECEVWGHPPPSIIWYKKGQTTQTGGKVAVGERNATLYIQSVRTSNEGTYTCEASNMLGRDRSTATIRVTVKPIILGFAGQVSSQLGTSVELPCSAVGIVPIKYTWTRGKTYTHASIHNAEDTQTADGGLRISSVQWSDAGVYYCTAENRAGSHWIRTLLTVTDEERREDKGEQTRKMSAMTDKEQPAAQFNDPVLKNNSGINQGSHSRAITPTGFNSHRPTVSFTSLKETIHRQWPRGSSHSQSQRLLNKSANRPVQSKAIQTLLPVLQPPPSFENSQSTSPSGQPPLIGNPVLFPFIGSPITSSKPQEWENLLLVTSSSNLSPQSQSTGTQLQHLVNKTPVQPSKTGGKVSEVSTYYTTPQPPVGVSAGLNTFSQTTFSTSRSLDAVKPTPKCFTHRENPVTQVDVYLPDSLGLSLSLHTTPHTSPHSFTQSPYSEAQLQPSPTQASIIELQLTQDNRTILKTSQSNSAPTPTPSERRSTQRFFPQSRPAPSSTSLYVEPLPPLPRQYSTTPHLPQSKSKPSSTHFHPFHTEPALPSHTQPQLPQIQTDGPIIYSPPSASTAPSPEQFTGPSTSDPEAPRTGKATPSDRIHSNASQIVDPARPSGSTGDQDPTERLKRNTSQSPVTSNHPRVTQKSPSWLPVLEKHDIPIVVGVGVSLAFILITMAFYSLFQNNEPVPTCRAAQRNVGVPTVRHAERRTTGKTYDNRAFEDDECVAVIEQSPNTSDTRARPQGPSLVMVQMEPTPESHGNSRPPLEDHAVPAETYPEPLLDSQVDPSVEKDKSCSLSQRSVQLQSVEDWVSSPGDSHGVCQDPLPPPRSLTPPYMPPPSFLPSRLPSPSPSISSSHSTVREERLHSSLTLQSAAEPCTAAVQHSLNISHASTPLLLSHHVSVGLTTVTVDVHFYPPATAAMAIATSTHINSVSNTTSATGPLFNFPLANGQENDQSAFRMQQNK